MKKVATFFAIAAVVVLSACGSKPAEETTEMVDTTAILEETSVVVDTMAVTTDTMAAPADTMAH